MRKFSKGQSTLEYVIILAAVVGAIIVIANVFKPKLQTSYDTIGTSMQTKVESMTF